MRLKLARQVSHQFANIWAVLSDEGEEHVIGDVSLERERRQVLSVHYDAVDIVAVGQLLRDDQLFQPGALFRNDFPDDSGDLL